MTWLGAARPLTWPHPGVFCVPNTQLALTLDARGSASLCQGTSRRTGRGCPVLLGARWVGAGAGASAFASGTGSLPSSHIVSKKNRADGEHAQCPPRWLQ